MGLGSRRAIAALATVAVCLPGGASAGGQGGPPDRPPMAEEVFKNVQVLKGIPVDQFMGAMGFFSNALSANCTYCHLGGGGGGWEQYALDNEPKRTARRMVEMMNAINQTYFGGRRVVTCVSCHNGARRPKVAMSMATVYGAEPIEEPEDIVRQAPGAPSADQVLDRFIEAVGGAARLAGFTSLAATGSHLGYEAAEPSPVEIFARAANQLATIIHAPGGDVTTILDGRAGWVAMPLTDTPVPLRPLTGGDLEGARLDVALLFPARVKEALGNWRGAVPAIIDDRDVWIVQGTDGERSPVRLYFDFETGLLVRLVRYTDAMVGRNPTQIDYADYRDVAGVKMPYRWIVTWQSGRDTFELTDVQPNAPIDAGRFARPAPPRLQ